MQGLGIKEYIPVVAGHTGMLAAKCIPARQSNYKNILTLFFFLLHICDILNITLKS